MTGYRVFSKSRNGEADLPSPAGVLDLQGSTDDVVPKDNSPTQEDSKEAAQLLLGLGKRKLEDEEETRSTPKSIEIEEEPGNEVEQSYFQSKGSSRWMEREDVFLSGLVLDMYYRRHSLKPTWEEKKEARDKGISCEMLVWQGITTRYNVARQRFGELTGLQSPDRSIKSLQRHWKETGLKKYKQEEDFQIVPTSKIRERKWEGLYNFDNVLVCPNEYYEAFKNNQDNLAAYVNLHRSSYPSLRTAAEIEQDNCSIVLPKLGPKV